MLVTASMEPSIGSGLAVAQIAVGREEIVPGPAVKPDLVVAADRNGGDNSTVKLAAVAGDVDNDGLGLVVECGTATDQRLVAWPECKAGRAAVPHQEGVRNLLRARINDGNPAYRRVAPDLRNRHVEQAGISATIAVARSRSGRRRRHPRW